MQGSGRARRGSRRGRRPRRSRRVEQRRRRRFSSVGAAPFSRSAPPRRRSGPRERAERSRRRRRRRRSRTGKADRGTPRGTRAAAAGATAPAPAPGLRLVSPSSGISTTLSWTPSRATSRATRAAKARAVIRAVTWKVSPLVVSVASACFPPRPKMTPPPHRLVEACPPAISRTSPGARRATSVAGSPLPSRRSRARPTEAVASPRGHHRTASDARAIASAWASCAPSPGVTATAGVDRTCPPWTSACPRFFARSASACPRRTRSTSASLPTVPPRPANARASGQPPQTPGEPADARPSMWRARHVR